MIWLLPGEHDLRVFLDGKEITDDVGEIRLFPDWRAELRVFLSPRRVAFGRVVEAWVGPYQYQIKESVP